jgi:hypothetical protein
MHRLGKCPWSLKRLVAGALLATLALAGPAAAQSKGKNGTTLAAYKTIDICEQTDGSWLYSGVIAVWNEGAVDTQGLAITDCIQNKTGSGQFVDQYCTTTFAPAIHEITKGTTLQTASTFEYSIVGAPLDGYIRNRVKLTITNHSGALGTPTGPEPKATYTGDVPPRPCDQVFGCTLTQGYWQNHPEDWPAGFSPSDTFFLATKQVCVANCGGNPNDDVYETPPASWADVLAAAVNLSQGYYQLAHQYIAAVLNIANGASVPDGVQDTLDLAAPWLAANAPSACTASGSCGLQKDWAAVLDEYNNGVYPGGPPHCP